MKISEIMDLVMEKNAADYTDADQKGKMPEPPEGKGPNLGVSEAGEEKVELMQRMMFEEGKELEKTPRQGDPDEEMNAAQKPKKEKMPPKGDVGKNPVNLSPAATGNEGTPAPGAEQDPPDMRGGKMAQDAYSLAQTFAGMAERAKEAGNMGDAQQLQKQAQYYANIAERAHSGSRGSGDSSVKQAFNRLANRNGATTKEAVESAVETERQKLAQEYFGAGQIFAQGFFSGMEDQGFFNKRASQNIVPALEEIRDNQSKLAQFVVDLAEELGFAD